MSPTPDPPAVAVLGEARGHTGFGAAAAQDVLTAEPAVSEKLVVRRKLTGPLGVVVTTIAVGMAIFHLYTAGASVFTAMVQRSVHLAFALVLIFLLYPAATSRGRKGIPFVDVVLAGLSVVGCLYITINWDALSEATRIAAPTRLDIALGIMTTLLVLEATRRTTGMALPSVAGAFILYAFAGPYMPGALGHPGIPLDQFIGMNYLFSEGLFGSVTGISATFIVVFIIFGAFLEASGGGKFFIDLASAGFGSVRGGPAKIATVGSGFFGMISGSAVANVVGSGTFTIPLMKRVGYTPSFAAAVEAVASTGGLLMPPVMGAAAFVMAELLSVSYLSVCLAAAVPAALYYLSLFRVIDLEAAKCGLSGMDPRDRPRLTDTLIWGGHLIVPPLVLVYLLAIVQWSAMKAGFYAVVATVAVAALRASTRLDARSLLNALSGGAVRALQIAAVCATAGIVVSIVSITGLGLTLSSVLIDLAQGQLWLLLVLTMVTSLILGMGLPATPCYIILAVLAAPAIVQSGVTPIAAHLFVFYFGCLSAVTPPVAVAAYAGAAVAGCNPMAAGLAAARIALVAFIIPYMFVYGPSLLMIGAPWRIAQAALTSMFGVTLFAAAIQGFALAPLSRLQRGALLVSALLLIKPGSGTDVVGLVGALVVLGLHVRAHRRGRAGTRESGGLPAEDAPASSTASDPAS